MQGRILALLLLLSGCSGGSNGGDAAPADAPDSGTPIPDLVGSEGEQSARELAEDVLVPPVPFGFENRGWKVLRGIVHLHSAYSHDGCAPDGYEDFGGPDPECIAQLRAAPCAMGIDFIFQSDHPGSSEDHTFEEVVHYQPDKGDELLKDGQGRPVANRIACPEGSLVERAYFYFGTEGHKSMPLAMSPPVPAEVFHTSYHDEVPLDKVQAAVAMTHELGGLAWGVHNEDPEISVARMIAIPLDGMEIYNLHANLMTALGDMDTLLFLDRFMGEKGTGPHPDLSLLLFLAEVGEDVAKFRQIALSIPIAHASATDIHRNVEVPAFCPGGIEGSLCEPFAKDYPNFAQFAMTGGPVPLSDGDRMDSYARSFRWFANRTLVQGDDALAIRESVGAGRSFTCFELFGSPMGFDFFVQCGDKTLEMGSEAPWEEGCTAYLRTPKLGPPAWGGYEAVAFGEAAVTVVLERVGAKGTADLLEVQEQGRGLAAPLPGPGAYWVRATVKPKHLAPLLPGLDKLTVGVFPYIYSNAVFLR
jgi:hypothetical protein